MAFAAASVLAWSGAQAACLSNGQPVSGEVRLVKTRDISSHILVEVPFLVTHEPVCVDSTDIGRSAGRWIEIVLGNGSETKRLLPGSHATITARYDAPTTLHHYGDVMAWGAKIVRVEEP
jgi:hypothetical protein